MSGQFIHPAEKIEPVMTDFKGRPIRE